MWSGLMAGTASACLLVPSPRLLYHALRCPSVVGKATGWVCVSGTLGHFDSCSEVRLVNHDVTEIMVPKTGTPSIPTQSGDDRARIVSKIFIMEPVWSRVHKDALQSNGNREIAVNGLWTLCWRSVLFDPSAFNHPEQIRWIGFAGQGLFAMR